MRAPDLLRAATARGAVDFDDLVVRAGELLATDPRSASAGSRGSSHVCVDEFQDVDAAQLRLVRLLAAPEDNLFVVGDDDQTIYAWRLADVRRILRFADDYPDARRVMLATNYRCPAAVIEASARMVAVNRERFAKPIRAPSARARRRGDLGDELRRPATGRRRWRMARSGEDRAGRTLCFLSRTRGELTPILLALVAAGVRHTAAVPPIVEAAPSSSSSSPPATATIAAIHSTSCAACGRRAAGTAAVAPATCSRDEDHAALDALLGWTTGFRTVDAFVDAYAGARARIAALRDPDALVELATVHASKGRSGRPSCSSASRPIDPEPRSLVDADDPDRAMEEERRLAYVAVTRATRRLILAFDPATPSPFLAEMGLGVGRWAAPGRGVARVAARRSGRRQAHRHSQGWPQVAAGVRRRRGAPPPPRAEVDDPVGGLDDVEVVLDDDDRVPASTSRGGRSGAARCRRSAGRSSARRGCRASCRSRASTARWRA